MRGGLSDVTTEIDLGNLTKTISRETESSPFSSRAFHGKEAIWNLLPSIVYFFFKQTEDAAKSTSKAKALAILGFTSFQLHH